VVVVRIRVERVRDNLRVSDGLGLGIRIAGMMVLCAYSGECAVGNLPPIARRGVSVICGITCVSGVV